MPSIAIQSYDPYQLITEVTDLLRERGLTADLVDGSNVLALTGACQLLRALGIFPGIDSIEYYKRYGDRIWGESQDVPPSV